MASLFLAVLAGFLVNVILTFIIPPANEIIGGAVAGYLAGGSIGRAVLAGFLAGILGAVIISILVLFVATAVLMPLLAPLLGPFAGLLPLVALIPLFLGMKGALLSALGGFLGGLAAQYLQRPK